MLLKVTLNGVQEPVGSVGGNRRRISSSVTQLRGSMDAEKREVMTRSRRSSVLRGAIARGCGVSSNLGRSVLDS